MHPRSMEMRLTSYILSHIHLVILLTWNMGCISLRVPCVCVKTKEFFYKGFWGAWCLGAL